jgi:hypothetical protein
LVSATQSIAVWMGLENPSVSSLRLGQPRTTWWCSSSLSGLTSPSSVYRAMTQEPGGSGLPSSSILTLLDVAVAGETNGWAGESGVTLTSRVTDALGRTLSTTTVLLNGDKGPWTEAGRRALHHLTSVVEILNVRG